VSLMGEGAQLFDSYEEIFEGTYETPPRARNPATTEGRADATRAGRPVMRRGGESPTRNAGGTKIRLGERREGPLQGP